MILPDLPSDIILDILERFWSKKDLGTMRLLSSSFAALVRPVLFDSCSFHITCPKDKNYSPEQIRQWQSRLDRHMHRLEFLSSPDIAQFIRTIRIYPEPRMHTGASINWLIESDMDANAWLNQFLERLPLFVNLKTLQCEDVTFDELAIEQIFNVKQLIKLDIRDCPITERVKPAEDGIEVRQMYFSSASRDPHRAESYARWLGIVKAHSIQNLRLSFANSDIAHEFLSRLRSMPIIPLTHLIMPHDPQKSIPGSQNHATIVLTMQLASINGDILNEITSRFPLVRNLTLLIGSAEVYGIKVCHI
ncbi:hypothetical protein HWV62_27170 [Athelia sp. TMB]|nr:hypothetical protein HWV62_37775 [Athelia sp. TMB]KAF7982683.1 hypothetical protein HWV62_27170 [Athelia sp. TMB]